MRRPTRTRWFLREWRQHRGLTQERLGARLDISKGRISELESGKVRYNQDLLEGLAEALDCTPGDLLSRNPLEPDPSGGLFDAIRRIPLEERERVRAIIETFMPRDPPGAPAAEQKPLTRRKRTGS